MSMELTREQRWRLFRQLERLVELCVKGKVVSRVDIAGDPDSVNPLITMDEMLKWSKPKASDYR